MDWFKSLYISHWLTLYYLKTCTYAEKTKRLKEAKEEAQAEIEAFRREREKAFQVYQSEVKKLFNQIDLLYLVQMNKKLDKGLVSILRRYTIVAGVLMFYASMD